MTLSACVENCRLRQLAMVQLGPPPGSTQLKMVVVGWGALKRALEVAVVRRGALEVVVVGRGRLRWSWFDGCRSR
jgi:hypothetical protein